MTDDQRRPAATRPRAAEAPLLTPILARGDRRRLPRAAASLCGGLWRTDGLTLGCHTRDASLSGLFLELSTDEPRLHEGRHVRVEFIAREPGGTRCFGADATIARCVHRGLGLRFERHQLNMLGYLYGLVHGDAALRQRTLERVRLRVVT